MRVHPVALFVACMILASSTPGHATTVLPMSLEDLVDRSEVVAHVRVGQVRILQQDNVPFRVTELEVIEAFQGARRGEVLELWQRGDGQIFVVGDPFLEEGQEGLAFLRRVEGRVYLTALAQSFWWIDGQGVQAVARRDLDDLAIVPLGEPRVMPPNRLRWAELRELVIDACLGVTP